MTQKILNDGVKIIGVALRVMLAQKKLQATENDVTQMYFDSPGCTANRSTIEKHIDDLKGLLHNLDGCNELMPIFNQATDANGKDWEGRPISVGSPEERTELLRQIADLESKLDQADKSFKAQGERYQKAWDERTNLLNTKDREIEKLRDYVKVLESSGPKWGEISYEGLCNQNTKYREENRKLTEEIDSLRNQLSSMANSLDGSDHVRIDLINSLQRMSQKNTEVLSINKELNKRWIQLIYSEAELVKQIEEYKSANNNLSVELGKHISYANDLRDEIKSVNKRLEFVIDERDRAYKTRDIARSRSKSAMGGLTEVKNILNKGHFNSVEKCMKIRAVVEQPWSQIVEAAGAESEPPKHWDCGGADQLIRGFDMGGSTVSAMAASAMEKVTQATPVDTGAVKESIKDTMTVKLNVDTSDLNNVFIGEPKSLTVDHNQMIVEIYVDKDAQADTLRKCADKVEARHLRG